MDLRPETLAAASAAALTMSDHHFMEFHGPWAIFLYTKALERMDCSPALVGICFHV